MTTITIPQDTTQATIESLKNALAQESRHNPDWNGAIFDLVRDDFTSINCNDEIAGAALLRSVIYPILDKA